MNTHNQEVIVENSLKYNANLWGVIAGVGMATFLIGIQLTGMSDSIAIKFFKYIVLAIVLMFVLSQYSDSLGAAFKYKFGVLRGLHTSIVAGITLAAINVLLFFSTDTLAFDKFTQKGNSLAEAMVISGALFFEVLVFGMILSLVWLQYLKRGRPSE